MKSLSRAIFSVKRKSYFTKNEFFNSKRSHILIKALLTYFIIYGFISLFPLLDHHRTVIEYKPKVLENIPPRTLSKRTKIGNTGECDLFEKRHPDWVNHAQMRKYLPEFSKIYAKRPFKYNSGGMLFEHSFFLFYTLRSLKPAPKFIVESGAHRGHTSWMIKQALPNVKLISISPESPKIKRSDVEYLVAENFTDFNAIDWESRDFDKAHAFVLLDDHQNNFRRIYQEGYSLGFRRFMIDDNWGYLGGDCLSLRWVCERKRKNLWPGWVKDNFNKIKLSQTWDEHVAQGEKMKNHTQFYYEFPALFPNRKKRSKSKSVFTDVKEYKAHVSSENEKEFQRQVLITYIETK